MSNLPTENKHRVEPAQERGTVALLEYFWSGTCDLHLFHVVIDAFLAGDYVAYIARRALDGKTDIGHAKPIELATKEPGPRIITLRRSRQELLEMFLTRVVDNFQVYLTEIIRMVLRKRPEILSGRKQEISVGYILGFDSIESLTQDIVEAKVNSLSYEGFAEIEEWCNGRGIPLLVPHGDRDKVVELIATRNLVVHNRGAVDNRYLKVVSSARFVSGQKRQLEVDEFFDALDLLNRIVNVTDSAIAGKFDLARTEIPAEIQARGEKRWPRLTESADANVISESQTPDNL